ncbi:MAG TPA: AbrB/MazE/SpoVT family DNA-binding domain-containing protein [Terriglobales bacterium]|nr:AbrB/MazE/SpoVT family DNA-binding domain-containing protein [Terriglobales bacterium]
MSPTRVTFTSKGQVVIPAELRRKHKIHAGTEAEVFEDPLGRIVLQPITEEYIDHITGMLGPGSNLIEELAKERRAERQREKF